MYYPAVNLHLNMGRALDYPALNLHENMNVSASDNAQLSFV